MIGDLADGLLRGAGNLGDSVSGIFSEPVIRLGVTGLSRAGKTVFITSLVANLMDRGRMTQLPAAANGTIAAAYLQPQPDDTVPRFDYETHLGALTGPDPHWPESTRAISQLRLSLRLRPSGMLGGFAGPRTLHLDIVDYPGEWLLDLGLLGKSYSDWAAETLERMQIRGHMQAFQNLLAQTDPTARLQEPTAKALASAFTAHLHAARADGFSDCGPGRFLLPGELEGSPVLTFAPLPKPENIPRGALWREMERRFEAYKTRIVKPFFRNHFARIDRQVVLVDALGALHGGPRTLEDLRHAMADILGAFRPGRNAWLSRLMRGRQVDRILFAATKADHLHHSQHSRLDALVTALMREARDRADFAGARTSALSIAALRATVEETRMHEGRNIDLVRGTLLETGRQAALHPGDLPEDPAHLLGPARKGDVRWLDADYAVMRFAPAALTLRPGEGPPHIRLDRAAQFLIGDRLR